MNKALKWLGAVLLLLFVAPRMSVRLGPIPVYFIDGLIAVAWMHALKLPKPKYTSPMTKWVLIIIVVATLSEIHGIFYIHDVLRPVYVMIRTALAISLFFMIPRVVRSRESVLFLFKCICVGLAFNAGMMLMSSMPPTRGLARLIFDLPFVEPVSSESIEARFSDTGTAVRGRSLIGVSILTGAFLNIAWPIALFLKDKTQVVLSGKWGMLILAGCVLAPLGILASYSRGAILAWCVVVCGAVFFTNSKALKRGVIVGVISLVSIVGFIGTDSELFFFDRLEKRAEAMMHEPMKDERETDRLYAYLDPFLYVVDFPICVLVGTGNARDSMDNVPFHPIFLHGADHAVVAQATYSYGLLSAVCYFALLMMALWHTFSYVRETSFTGKYAQTLFLCLLGVGPWFMLGHAVVSQPRGAMVFFMVLGFVSVLTSSKPVTKVR